MRDRFNHDNREGLQAEQDLSSEESYDADCIQSEGDLDDREHMVILSTN